MKRPPIACCQSRAGSVFVVVLLVCLGLVSLTLLFGNSMYMAYRGADNSLAGHQAEQAIEGAARYAEYLMGQVSRPGATPDPTAFQSGTLPIGEATCWFIGAPSSTDPVDQPVFGLVDEASKLNLNTASQEMLETLPGMTPDLASQILAWRGASSGSSGVTISFSGAIKGSPFETVEELMLVSGTDATLLYGDDANLNHVIDPNESSSGTAFTTGDPDRRINSGLLEYVTVFSREPNTRADGSARINVTQTFSTALKTLLTQELGSSREAEIEQKIRAAGTIGNVLQFYIRSGMTEEEFEKVASDLTATGSAYLNGLVNINTASASVLACIPGIGTDNASSLVTTRSDQASTPSTIAWIVPILGEANAIKAAPYLTANSYQLCVDIAAVGRNGRGFRRTRFVIDNSTGTPRIVHRRNLTPLGWALGSNVRDALALKKESQP